MHERCDRFKTIGAIFTAAALLALTAGSCSRKTPPSASPSQEEASPAAKEPVETAELEQLRVRAAALEAQLASLADKNTPPADDASAVLMGHLDNLNGPGMYTAMEKRLLGEEKDHRELLQFFIACDQEHEKILTLTHDSRLVFAMLRLVALYPGETAALCAYMIRNTREQTGSFVRREIYNFLPVFLNYHRGKYPELRRLLKEDIVFQLQKGGDYLYKLMLAMRDLQFKPPVDSMLPILYSEEKRSLHGAVLSHLASRGDEGLQAILKFVEEGGDGLQQSVSQALKHIVDLDAAGRRGLALRFVEHQEPAIRKAATFYYFGHPREPADFERALGYLNSEVTVAQQTLIIGKLKRNSPAIYQQLIKESGKVRAEKAKAILEKAAARAKKEAGNEG